MQEVREMERKEDGEEVGFPVPPPPGLSLTEITLSFAWRVIMITLIMIIRGEVEDTRIEAKTKAKDTKNSRPRPRTAFLRTDPLEDTDSNALGQGPRTQPQVFSKKKVFKKAFQAISNL